MTGADGDLVLVGAFFTARPGVDAPTPAGDLVVWHSHGPGSRRMLHVWTAEEVELVGRRDQPVTVRVVDPFGAPFRASVERS